MRGKPAPKRKINPDTKYSSLVIAKLINYVMRRGKRTTAERVVYGAFDMITEKTKLDALDVFDRALKNVQPTVEVRSKRVGGANYQIPVPVRGDRKIALGFRWIIAAAEHRSGRGMSEKLADEFIAASNNEGDAMKKKADVNRMAEANRAFAHFAK